MAAPSPKSRSQGATSSRLFRCRCNASRAVSFAVSFSRHSVDLRVRCYDTDAQDLAYLLLGLVTRSPKESHGVDAPTLPHPAASAPPALRAGYASGGRGLSCGRCAASLRLTGCAGHRRFAPDASNPAVPTGLTRSTVGNRAGGALCFNEQWCRLWCCFANRSEEHTSELQSLTNLVC